MRGRAGRGPIRSGLWFGVGNKVAKAARANGHMGGRIDDLEYVPAPMAGERRLGEESAPWSTDRTALPQIVSADPTAGVLGQAVGRQAGRGSGCQELENK